MHPIVGSSDPAPEGAIAFLATLIRLQRAVWEVGLQVDRIEVEMREALSELDRERFEENR